MSTEFRCPNCGVLFGMLDETESIMTIKYRDLFRYVHYGKVSGPCRGCKSNVTWVQRTQESSSDDPATR